MITALLASLFLMALPQTEQNPVSRDSFEVTTISRLPEANEEYFLAYPWHITGDSEGRIYVADYASADIKIFSRDGIYFKTIGGRGKGPGEFIDITAMQVDGKDRLLVADHHMTRWTRFDNRHQVEKIHTYHTTDITWPENILQFGDQYLIGYLLHVPPDLLSEVEEYQSGRGQLLFHFMSEDLEHITREFGNLYHLDYSDQVMNGEFFRYLSQSRLGSVQQFEENAVVFAHTLYNGYLYRITEDNEITAHPGYRTDIPTFRTMLVDGEEDELLLSESIGLHQLESGGYIHFSLQRVDGEYEVMVEQFSSDLELVKYGGLSGSGLFEEHPPTSYDSFRVDHYADGTFYAIEYNPDQHSVWMFQLEEVR